MIYGACTSAAIEAVERYGLTPIQWDVSSSDPWKGQSVDGMVKTVLQQVKPGSIVLFHANGRGWKTDDAIPIIIAKLKQQGYSFARVDDLMKMDGVEPEYSPVCYDFRENDVNRYQTLARKLERQYVAFYRSVGKPPRSTPDSHELSNDTIGDPTDPIPATPKKKAIKRSDPLPWLP